MNNYVYLRKSCWDIGNKERDVGCLTVASFTRLHELSYSTVVGVEVGRVVVTCHGVPALDVTTELENSPTIKTFKN